jgi:elongation factor Ts
VLSVKKLKSVLSKDLDGTFVGSYIHAGNKIASLTSLSANVEGAEDAAKAVSMQVAAMNPLL